MLITEKLGAALRVQSAEAGAMSLYSPWKEQGACPRTAGARRVTEARQAIGLAW